MVKNFLNAMAGNETSDMQKILNRSRRAVCGQSEREVIIKESDVERTKKILKKSGFVFVGKGPAGGKNKKVWFNPAVSL